MKYALVTGATNGLGIETARALAAQQCFVLVHGRDPKKGAATVASLKSATANQDIQFVEADFTSLGDVRALAARVDALVPRLDLLVNNAGCAMFSRHETRDGYEMTFAVNHLAPYLLTTLLLPKIKASAPARIVNVASAAHRHQRLDFDDLMSRREYKTMNVYGRSKLANILFTRALAKRLAGSGVTVNSLHPGVVRTGIGQNNPLMRAIGGIVMHFRGIPVEEGARTSIYLAISPEVEGKSGDYYVECKPSPYRTSADALDDATAERLWRVSEELVSAFRSLSPATQGYASSP